MAAIVQYLNGFAGRFDRLRVGLIGQIEPSQPVIAGGEPDPGLGILRSLLDRVTEVTVRYPVGALVEMLQADFTGSSEG